MQKFNLAITLVVVLGLLSVYVSALDPPASTVTISSLPPNVTLVYSSVIGANYTAQDGGNSGNIYNEFDDPAGMRWFPASNYSYHLGGPGLLTTDSAYDRILFFSSNNLNAPQYANIVFGAALGESSSEGSTYAVDYTSQGIYGLIGDSVYYWNYSSLNLGTTGAPVAFPYPDSVFGNLTVSNQVINNYQAIYSAVDMLTKKSTGEIFVADSGCSRIVVYPPTANSGNQQPSYVIGQNDSVSCDAYTCSSYSPTTCLESPNFIALDCYDGLWVYDGYTYAFYYFPNGTKVATFSFNATEDLDTYFDDVQGIVQGPGCGYITVLGSGGANFIISVSYASGIGGLYTVTSVSAQLAFGSAFSSADDLTTTSTLSNTKGLAYGPNNTAIYASDYQHDRLVVFNLSSLVNSAFPSVPVTLPSNGASSNPSTSQRASTNPQSTSTATASSTASAVPLSSGASQTNSPSEAASFSPESGTSVSESESGTPTYYNPPSAATQLNSWVNLF